MIPNYQASMCPGLKLLADGQPRRLADPPSSFHHFTHVMRHDEMMLKEE